MSFWRPQGGPISLGSRTILKSSPLVNSNGPRLRRGHWQQKLGGGGICESCPRTRFGKLRPANEWCFVPD
jgi:hypothetical protein